RPVLSAASPGRRTGDFVILAGPFTSKEEPSERYWSELLTGLVPPELDRPVRLVVDSGPTPATASFAAALARAARGQEHPRVRLEVARGGRGGRPTLGETIDGVCAADVVVAADSFLAHVAPLFGVPALIVAREGLEDWRVPSGRNFYFRAEDPVA